MSTQVDQSYGIIPLRKEANTWYTLLIQHKYGGHWGFPKGHLEQNETPWEGAARELYEETALSVITYLSLPPLQETYTFLKGKKLISKTVTYWFAFASGEFIPQESEIIQGTWCTLEEALHTITFQEQKKLWNKGMVLLSSYPAV